MGRERALAMSLKELAASLGLSQTTVSRALNGYPEVGEKTRRRVLEAAERANYRASTAARSAWSLMSFMRAYSMETRRLDFSA